MAALSAFVNEPQPRSYLAGIFEPNIFWIVADRSSKLLFIPQPPVIKIVAASPAG